MGDLAAEADFLPDLEQVWNDEPAVNRDTWYFEWQELMDRLLGLEEAWRTGQMTPDQERRYRALCRRLEDAVPLLRRLELPLPAIQRHS